MKHLNYLKQLLLPVLLLLVTSQQSFAVLNGTYTIGGASPNYATLSAAITDLVNQGVNGPVVFNIRSGSYTGSSWQGSIANVAGASSTNTITFQAESGPGTVTIDPQATLSNLNFVFRFAGGSYITVQNLTLSNSGTTYGTDIELGSGSTSSNITIQNCILTGATQHQQQLAVHVFILRAFLEATCVF